MTGDVIDYSPVVLRLDPPVATIVMRDHEGRNAIRPPLQRAMRRALATAAAEEDIRVVVVTGLPEVFCAGAARETLLGVEGGQKHDDYEPFARLFPRCPLPVITAMDGHAIGGGLVVGLYADIPVLSERSLYAANFLQYGMAPYIGTTHVIPSRLGEALGAEMILTGRSYRGSELRARGASVLVVPHDKVMSTAKALAHQVAKAPRRSLELVKAQLSARIMAATDTAMAAELGPHLDSAKLPVVRQLAASGYGPPTPASAMTTHVPGNGSRVLPAAGRAPSLDAGAAREIASGHAAHPADTRGPYMIEGR
ncbi:polyketide synthase [Catellatospora coxensis]|uniref:Enoyl-CoA hydratase n=1 Tax=Catellatospora coxensis TaxID=310354 RepID=A0A8J3KQB3_9ACTN|nr:polyketide synthase [Catellatospora coxensis]GIG07137.1 enoyl-CoA hydratase [Catellatospora coxensis]